METLKSYQPFAMIFFRNKEVSCFIKICTLWLLGFLLKNYFLEYGRAVLVISQKLKY